jgi:hypothetical protein
MMVTWSFSVTVSSVGYFAVYVYTTVADNSFVFGHSESHDDSAGTVVAVVGADVAGAAAAVGAITSGVSGMRMVGGSVGNHTPSPTRHCTS